MQQLINFDRSVLNKYDVKGPRYTSYPTAADFVSDFSGHDFLSAIKNANLPGRPLSLYMHIPFCESLCYYCGCSKIVTQNRDRAEPYLSALIKEIELYGELIGQQRPVTQLHWGGGTPTFLNAEQMQRLMDVTRQNFCLAPDDESEYSIEIDPRRVDRNTIGFLRSIGFNRLSFGVQDFTLDVQQAINRVQPFEQTELAIKAGREFGFKSINTDLIYGLPKQTLASFQETLLRLIALSPDRISLFNYAHMPHMFKSQRMIDEADIPTASAKLDLLEMSVNVLVQHGYVYIGMDHFAKPSDELAIAKNNGTLHRNFQGYTTGADIDLLGLGLTSISKMGDCFAQNFKAMPDYLTAINAGEMATTRGILLDHDDVLRRNVIALLSCEMKVLFSTFNTDYDIDFQQYFYLELERLRPFVDDGLVALDEEGFVVTEKGKLMLRAICMVFDRYRFKDEQIRFSKVI